MDSFSSLKFWLLMLLPVLVFGSACALKEPLDLDEEANALSIGLTVTDAAPHSVDLQWDKREDLVIEEIMVERSLASVNPVWETVATLGPKATTHHDKRNVNAETSYWYRLEIVLDNPRNLHRR